MTPNELGELCADAIKAGRDVQLVVPREARGERITLAGRGSPMGEIACVNNGSTVAWFDPTKVLAWLVAIGAARVVEEAEEHNG